MNWQEVVTTLGGTGAILTFIYFIGSRAIDAFVAGRVESFKNELSRHAYEHQVQFQSLHTERAESIKTLYAKISNLDDILHSTLNRFQPAGDMTLEQKVAKLSSQFNGLRSYYQPRKIFFTPEVCVKIEEILGLAKGIFFDITTHSVDPKNAGYGYNPEVLKERHEFWEKARAVHKKEFSETLVALESEFRAMFGVRA